MNSLTKTPISLPNSSHADSAQERRALESWSNEGGHLPAVPESRDLEHFASSAMRTSLEVQVDCMSRSLSADFANGLMAEHHNTLQHRSSVLRQMTTKLKTM
jgi:hypothetical protein